jgi:transcriptional regulator with XRE-family HTH domain
LFYTFAMVDLGTVIAVNMRHERSSRKWRQLDLAQRLDWPISRVTRIECGAQRVQVTDVRDLCDAFGIPLTALLADADPADLRALQLPGPADDPDLKAVAS